MSEITRVGADLAKSVIQVHGVNTSGKQGNTGEDFGLRGAAGVHGVMRVLNKPVKHGGGWLAAHQP